MAISFFQRISRAVMGKSRVDDRTLDAVEEALVESDMGVDTTLKIIDNLEDRVARDKFMSFDELVGLLRDEISSLIDDGGPAFDFSKKPYVILVVGVNGVGKTTTIGKLAYLLSRQGKKVILGAADTFRAAAVDQLDNLVSGIFPLLSSLGVMDVSGLSGLISDNLYTNNMVTTIAKGLYGAMEGDVASYLSIVGVDTSTKGVAKLLNSSGLEVYAMDHRGLLSLIFVDSC